MVELRADGAMIAAGSVHRTMPIAALVDRAHLMDAPKPATAGDALVNVSMTALTKAQRAAVEARATVVRQLLADDHPHFMNALQTPRRRPGIRSARCSGGWLAIAQQA